VSQDFTSKSRACAALPAPCVNGGESMPGRIYTVVVGIIAALGLSTLASAQSVPEARSIAEPNTVTVTPFLSGSFGTSDGLGGSIGLGVGVGYDFTRNLGGRGELGPLVGPSVR